MAAETKCIHCLRAIHPPSNDTPWWHDDDKYAASICPASGKFHEPAETKETK